MPIEPGAGGESRLFGVLSYPGEDVLGAIDRPVDAPVEPMKTLSDRLVRLVGIFGGFNRCLYHQDPELITAWESARHVVSGPKAKEVEAPAA
ncbi:MAG TPA: hypothetical protein VF046_01450 [Gemmatimonadales bacterium]